MNHLEIGGATALVGAAIFSVHSQYADHAGSLSDARKASPDSVDTMQRLMDADVLTGGLVILVGGAIGWATGQWAPAVLAVLGFALISVYYHAAAASPAAAQPSVKESVTYDNAG